MLELKGYFRNLHACLLKSNDFEKKLSRTAKQLTNDINNQKLELDRLTTKQFADYSMHGELKRECLKVSFVILILVAGK